MPWYNGQNWKRFQALQARQEKAWRQAGMTEEQIGAMREFDREVFRSDRRYYAHTDAFPEPGRDTETGPELPDPAEDDMPPGVRLRWLEEIEDPALMDLLSRQKPMILRIITLTVYEGRSLTEAARLLGCSRQWASYVWNRFCREAAVRLRKGSQASGGKSTAPK